MDGPFCLKNEKALNKVKPMLTVFKNKKGKPSFSAEIIRAQIPPEKYSTGYNEDFEDFDSEDDYY